MFVAIGLIGATVLAITAARTIPTNTDEKESVVVPETRPSASNGKAIYDEHCLKCHGETGSGEGEDAKKFKNEMKDFNDQTFMRKESPAKFFDKVKKGDKPMPAFEEDLTDQEMWDVVFYVWTFQNKDDLLAQGRQSYDEKCTKCHGASGDGKGPEAGDLEEEPTDFTDLKHMLSNTSNDMFEAITDGEKDEGMPAFKKKLSKGEIWNVVNHIWTFVYED